VDTLPEFGWGTVFTQARFELWPVLAIVVFGGFYTLGMRQLVARGDRWPVVRTLSFGVGLLVIAVATVSGLATYDDDLFGAHMIQHMLLSMVAPVFLALGAPVTLALRTLPAGGRERTGRVASLSTRT